MNTTENEKAMGRRHFMRHAGLATAAVAAIGAGSPHTGQVREARKLPVIKLGGREVTRLITGYNTVGGYSHATSNLSKYMRDYFTVERTVAFLQHCEEEGINTFQFDLSEKVERVLDILWDTDTQLQFLCLHAERSHDAPLDKLMSYNPFAIAHHGGVTDALFRAGRKEQVHDFVKKVHDHGALAGVSSHHPVYLQEIADAGWEVDFFMACFHRVSRTKEEMAEELGFVTVGEPFIESDRDAMAEVVRAVDQPCLVFKILAAGRRCSSDHGVSQAFQYAFDHIKPSDAVIVGMFPVFQDEVAQNAALTRQFGRG